MTRKRAESMRWLIDHGERHLNYEAWDKLRWHRRRSYAEHQGAYKLRVTDRGHEALRKAEQSAARHVQRPKRPTVTKRTEPPAKYPSRLDGWAWVQKFQAWEIVTPQVNAGKELAQILDATASRA